MSAFVTVNDADLGEAVTHLPGVLHDYATLCGLDGSDEGVGQSIVETPRGQKVNCVQCRMIWDACKGVKKSDFQAK